MLFNSHVNFDKRVAKIAEYSFLNANFSSSHRYFIRDGCGESDDDEGDDDDDVCLQLLAAAVDSVAAGGVTTRQCWCRWFIITLIVVEL